MTVSIILKLIPFSKLKILFLRILGAKIGKEVKIGYLSTIFTSNYSNIFIGDYVEIGHNVNIKISQLKIDNFSVITSNTFIDGNGKLHIGKASNVPSQLIDTSGNIEIGNYTGLSPNGLVYSHSYSETWFHEGEKYKTYNIKIGNNVWMGAGSNILNANIGDESLISAGSVVLQDIPKNAFVIGNPARVIKENQVHRMSKDLFQNKSFQNRILDNYRNKKIFFEYNLESNTDGYDIIICYKYSIDINTIKIPILVISENHIYNMKKNIFSIVKSMRSWGIFLSN